MIFSVDQAWLDARPDVQKMLRESLDETNLVQRGRPHRLAGPRPGAGGDRPVGGTTVLAYLDT